MGEDFIYVNSPSIRRGRYQVTAGRMKNVLAKERR